MHCFFTPMSLNQLNYLNFWAKRFFCALLPLHSKGYANKSYQ